MQRSFAICIIRLPPFHTRNKNIYYNNNSIVDQSIPYYFSVYTKKSFFFLYPSTILRINVMSAKCYCLASRMGNVYLQLTYNFFIFVASLCVIYFRFTNRGNNFFFFFERCTFREIFSNSVELKNTELLLLVIYYSYIFYIVYFF